MALPDDLSNLQGPTGGRVELPVWIHASGPAKVFDLENEDELAEVYEIVLTNGDEAAACTYVNARQLLRLWPRLRLPAYVRAAWDERLAATQR